MLQMQRRDETKSAVCTHDRRQPFIQSLFNPALPGACNMIPSRFVQISSSASAVSAGSIRSRNNTPLACGRKWALPGDHPLYMIMSITKLMVYHHKTLRIMSARILPCHTDATMQLYGFFGDVRSKTPGK